MTGGTTTPVPDPGVPCDHAIPPPSVAAVRAYLKAAGWTERPPGNAGSIWVPPRGSRLAAGIGVPLGDDNPDLLRGVIERVAHREGRTPAEVAREIVFRVAPPDEAHEAAAAAIPGEWVKAAEARYSMHGAGLIRNILAGVEPLIRAAERDRIIRLASEHKAICVCYCGMPQCGDERPGHPRTFADFIRERGEPQ